MVAYSFCSNMLCFLAFVTLGLFGIVVLIQQHLILSRFVVSPTSAFFSLLQPLTAASAPIFILILGKHLILKHFLYIPSIIVLFALSEGILQLSWLEGSLSEVFLLATEGVW